MTGRGPQPPSRAMPRVERRQMLPHAIAARILHQDDAVIVLDKPAGLPVHRGPRGGASLEDWLPALQQSKRHLPQPAHRLDTDTAGCLALGRTKPALAALGALFAEKRAKKTYWAVLRGVPDVTEGVIEAPLRKISSAARGWRMEAHPDGQQAVTRWQVLGGGHGLAWVALTPETGRTHQLRVHCAHRGWPILGDPLYGTAMAEGLHLLARSLILPLAPPVAATAPVPEAMRAAMRRAGWAAEG